MRQHRIEFGPKETQAEPESEHMLSIFQSSDRFTPLPSAYFPITIVLAD